MVCNVGGSRTRRALAFAGLLSVYAPLARGTDRDLTEVISNEPPRELTPRELTPFELSPREQMAFERELGVGRDMQAGPTRSPPAYWRAVLEMFGVLSIGVAQYWLNAGANRRDWDYPHFSDRFDPSAIRFDNNTHLTNNIMHPLAGSAYYGLARANGLNVPASAAYLVASSTVWEWALEWREKVSINDMMATSFGGIAAGEFLVHLAAYLNSAPAETNFGQDLAKTTLGFPVWMHDQLDDRQPDPRPARDNLGFSSAYHHRFTADYQNAWIDDAADRRGELQGVALDARLVALPEFLDPESFDVVFTRGNFTQGSLLLQFDDRGLQEAWVKFDAVLAGYYAQRSTSSVLGGLVGFVTGLEYLDRNTLDLPDQYALVRCAGPELGATWKDQDRQLDVRARATADFAAIRSLAWPEARSNAPDETYKSSLEGDYQYHYGLATRLTAELRLHAARISADFGWGGYRSIQGLDRFQEKITRDLAGKEVLDQRRLAFALEPPGTVLRFNGHVERLSHESWLGGETVLRLERRFAIGAGLVF
jgi:Domain of unknown function (DUF3943)